MQAEENPRRYVLTLDLKASVELQREYVRHHRQVWPEVLRSLRDSGVLAMEIYVLADRLCMVMDVNEGFSFERKAEMDASNESVQAWETLMEKFQRRLPYAKLDEKWAVMEKLFEL